MGKYYLRMEGVNLYTFLYDTHDLNTIRGGGLLLLRAAERVKNKFSDLEALGTGASIGFFSFDSPDKEGALAVRQKVADFLMNDGELCHATFAVDIQSAGEEFPVSHEVVLARNRLRQFRQPTVVIPAINGEPASRVCSLDRIRVGSEIGPAKVDKEKISLSVSQRRKHGVGKKQQFYREELKRETKSDFHGDMTNSFDELTSDHTKGNLHHKMAVIYLDGNCFGKIRDTLCPTQVEFKRFDRTIKKYQAELLERLLKRMEKDPDYRNGDNLYRLETLLWGGDELIWVVPAWRGWDVLAGIYEEVSRWSFNDRKLTLAGGMVFCHHKAPIHRITRIAEKLAEETKSPDGNENLFQYVVLESFDHVGNDLSAYRSMQCPAPWKTTLRGESMTMMADSIKQFKTIFPRGQIYTAVHSAIEDAGKETTDFTDHFTKRLNELLTNEASAMAAKLMTLDYFGDTPGVWLHLAELWDYIPGEEVQ